MVIALRANLQVALQLCAVQYLTAAVALGPYTFRDTCLTGGGYIAFNSFNPAH
ncbi:hypothetical protein HMPREF1144_0812 [Klebsiella sp. OBRC7]|nr:hypothetical protein CSC12_2101 [Klebsiella michiganensis]EJU21269.1 hypothetical protein HMPREF1144_0812 [Klebsiella sp. OBRC7]